MNSLKHGIGLLLVIVSYTLVLANAKYLPSDFSNESPDYERVLRSDSGFSRILRSALNLEDGFGEDPITDDDLKSSEHNKRSFEPASFSRILRNSFSRILKRAENSPSFARILRTSGFSRILRSHDDYQRNLRAQQFSRILKRAPESEMDKDFHREAKSTGFSRIL